MDEEPEPLTIETEAAITNPEETCSSKNEVALSWEDTLQSQPSTSGNEKSKKKNSKRLLPTKGKKPKKTKEPEEDEVETLLMGLSKDIDSVLEETAQRNQLTAINVKNILRHVITNEDVLAMVWNTMKLEGQENVNESELSAVYEQKLTRSTVRKLCGADVVPAKPSVCCDTITKKLLEEEFSENESSDEEYRPVSSIVDEDTDEESVSKRNRLVLDSPTTPRAILPFEELSEDSSLHIAEEEVLMSGDEDKIALRTRSKLPLNDTLLESIEAAFVAPDITTDMYDSECDDEDWTLFLGDFLKPVTAATVEGEDDDAEDPEYNFLEEEDVTDEWDLRNDRAVKVSKKELNDLVAELIEATDQEFISPGEEDTDEMVDLQVSPPLSITAVRNKAKEQSIVGFSELITPEVREVLDEQMRMHVQLLAQIAVLCSVEPILKTYRHSSQTLLLELKRFAGKNLPCGQKSAFSTYNLQGAIDLAFCNTHLNPTSSPLKPAKIRKEIPRNVQKLIAKSHVFVYPELLPVYALFLPSKIRHL